MRYFYNQINAMSCVSLAHFRHVAKVIQSSLSSVPSQTPSYNCSCDRLKARQMKLVLLFSIITGKKLQLLYTTMGDFMW